MIPKEVADRMNRLVVEEMLNAVSNVWRVELMNL